MKRAFEQAGLNARIFPLNISHSGASVIESPSASENDEDTMAVEKPLVK